MVEHSARAGYLKLKLDSLERLGSALRVYEKVGFKRCTKYCECPEADHLCMEMELGTKASG